MNLILTRADTETMTDSDWIEVGSLEDIPRRGARLVKTARGDVGVFRTMDDAVFALDDRYPHRDRPRSPVIAQGHARSFPRPHRLLHTKTARGRHTAKGPLEE